MGVLLLLIFFQQIAFGGFEQLLTLFTLGRLGLNASGNAILFVFVGIIVVAVQGGYVGKWSRQYGDRRVIFAGLALLAIGLLLLAFTPATARTVVFQSGDDQRTNAAWIGVGRGGSLESQRDGRGECAAAR